MAKKIVKNQDDEMENAAAPEVAEEHANEQEVVSRDMEEGAVDEVAGNNPEQLISDLQAKNEECQDKLLRMAADQDNFKKRMIRERETSMKYAEENILKSLLPTIDNLERALGQEQNNDDVKHLFEGVELTLKGLLGTLNKFGLTPIDSVGKPFDPNFHEALVMEASGEVPAQSIIKEFEKGYQYKDRLLRAAKVVVSKGEEE